MRKLAAHHAGVRFDPDRLEAAPSEDAGVGVVHFPVTGLRGLVRRVEAVSIFHDEFLRAHQSEAWADFVAELGLNLIKVLGHLPIRIDFAGDQGGDDFLMRRSQHPFLFGAVARLEENILHGFVAAALLPEVRGLQRGHQQLERARAVHLFADDSLDFSQCPHSERQESVKSASQLANQPRAQKQFVRDDLRFRRRFFECGNERLGPAHTKDEV